jgi:ElaB/YqjD/DUF883 family membrane-anchored ribosome-binding protein
MATYENSSGDSALNTNENARETADAAADAVESAKRTARAALETGRTYATGAVNAAGQKLDDVKVKVGRVSDQTAQYVKEQPMRAVGIAAAGGFLLAMVLNGLRRR